MPQTKSAKKAVRQTKKRTEYNKKIKEAIRKALKAARRASESGSKDASSKFREAQKILAKAAGAGVIHKRTAARKTSRLMKKSLLLNLPPKKNPDHNTRD